MFNQFTKGTLNLKFHLQLLKTLLLVTNSISLVIYIFMHFIFFDFPLETENEIVTLLKLFSTASLFALSICALVLLSDATGFVLQKRKQLVFPNHLKTVAAALVVTVIILASCNGPIISAGIKKDFNTGLSSTYTGMEPENVFLVMNNEVLNHTDIPIGESFLVVNDGIKGMQAKDGKVKVGCSLSISTQQGKVLLSDKDLFEGHDEFEEKDAKLLKCIVSTGEPMKWEE